MVTGQTTGGILLEDIVSADVDRIQTGPWDPCFGESLSNGEVGIVRGSTNIIAGAPGAGKSTMFLQMCGNVVRDYGKPVLYLSAEEQLPQIRARADRLDINGKRLIRFVDVRRSGSDLNLILRQNEFALLICDSLKALSESPEDQVAICKILKSYATIQHAPVVISHHVNKGEEIAGLMALQHEVDSTMTFFPVSDQSIGGEAVRDLETTKNRNGMAWVVRSFAMTAKGLILVPTDDDREEEEDEDDDE